eukprot:1419483-Rhodomonas_salina.2
MPKSLRSTGSQHRRHSLNLNFPIPSFFFNLFLILTRTSCCRLDLHRRELLSEGTIIIIPSNRLPHSFCDVRFSHRFCRFQAGAFLHAAKAKIALVMPDTSPRGAGIDGEDETWDFGTGAGFVPDHLGWSRM